MNTDSLPGSTGGQLQAPVQNGERGCLSVLVVDCDAGVLRFMESALRDLGYELVAVRSGTAALDELRTDDFAVVLADLAMGDVGELELLSWVKQHRPDTQVVLVTGRASLDSVIAALRGGAADYLTKPVDVDRLATVVRNAVSRHQLERENRELVKKLEEHQRFLQQRIREATHDLAEANKRLAELAIRDGLTNLYNHRHFQERLDEELKRARRYGRRVSLMMLDLDQFKRFNDTYGHQEGNEALRTVAELLTIHVREVDIVARYGGEEFAVILPIKGEASEIATVSERIREIVESTELLLEDDQVPHLTVSIGHATYPEDAQTRSDLIERADAALYEAKRQGRNCVVAFAALPPEQWHAPGNGSSSRSRGNGRTCARRDEGTTMPEAAGQVTPQGREPSRLKTPPQ